MNSIVDNTKEFITQGFPELIIGVVAGLISGVALLMLTKAVSGRKSNKEYQHKLTTANQEVLSTLRTILTELEEIKSSTLNAIISATASKFSIDPNDMYEPKMFLNHLLKDIIDLHFLSSSQKAKYVQMLGEAQVEANFSYLETATYSADYYSPFEESVLALSSLIVGLTVAFIAMLTITRTSSSTFQIESDQFILVIVSAIGIIVIMAAILTEKNTFALYKRIFAFLDKNLKKILP